METKTTINAIELFNAHGIKYQSFKFSNNVYVFKLKKRTTKNDITHILVVVDYEGQVMIKITTLTKHPKTWTRGVPSRKIIKRFKDKYVIRSIEFVDITTFYMFKIIFDTLINYDGHLDYKFTNCLSNYKPL